MFDVIYFISDHDKHLLLAFICRFFLSLADTIMTDNHSTDQNNNNNKNNVTDNSDENEINESMHNGKKI
jgi:hypothetical protein